MPNDSTTIQIDSKGLPEELGKLMWDVMARIAAESSAESALQKRRIRFVSLSGANRSTTKQSLILGANAMCKQQIQTHPLIGKMVRYRKPHEMPKEAVVVSSRSFKYLSGDQYTLLMLENGDEVDAAGCSYEFSPESFESAR